MVFLWFSHGFPMVFLWFSYGFPMVFPWFSYGFPMVFLWFSYGFPMVFLWFSYGFPMVFPLKPPFSHGFSPSAPPKKTSKQPPMRCVPPTGRSCERPKPPQGIFFDMGLSENNVPLNPMVNDHYPY